MALSAVYVFVPNTPLLAAQLNALNNNILQNPIALISPTTGAINFALQAHTGLPITALSATSGSTGATLTVAGGVPIWSTAGAAAIYPPMGSYVRGLTGTTTANLSTGVVTFSMNSALLQTTASTASYFCSATSAMSINISTSVTGQGAGALAGGRDQASTFTASRFVHCYAITTGPLSTAPSGIASTTPPNAGPVMPTSYSAWVYLAPVYYSGDSVFVPTIIKGHTVTYGSVTSSDGNVLVTSSATQTAGASHTVTFSGVVPTNANEWTMGYHIDAVASAEPSYIYLDSTSNVPYTGVAPVGVTGSPDMVIPMPNQASGSFKYALTATARTVRITAMNYRISNGDG